MAIQRPTLAVIRDRVLADIETNIDQKLPLLRKSILRVLGYVFSGIAHMLYGYIDQIAIDLFPDTCRGEYLDRWASIWGITRKAASYSTGSVVLTGTDGIVIAAGTAIIGTNQVEYMTTTSVTITAGAANVSVEAESPGEIGNVSPGASLSLVNPIPGVQSAVTVGLSGITGGTETESDDDLRDRLLFRIQTPPQGGAASDYKQWALEVSGITRAWITSAYQGPGTVGVAVVSDNSPTGIIPSPEKIQEVFDHIETVRPLGAAVYVYAPVPQVVNFELFVYPDTAAVREAVIDELSELFRTKGGPGNTIYLSEINATISNAAGEDHHVLVSPSDDIEPGPSGILTVGSFTWRS